MRGRLGPHPPRFRGCLNDSSDRALGQESQTHILDSAHSFLTFLLQVISLLSTSASSSENEAVELG